VLESRSADREPDPVIRLHGGPGGSAISGASDWLDHPLRDDRDLILLDQRGAGCSEPEICPQLMRDDMRILARVLSAEEATAERVALSLACRDALLDSRVDLASYNSDASAADLVDLRRVLGYENWNLYGTSYGTKLALTALRNSSEGIRSVVLDSAYPPGVRAFDHRTLNFVRALQAVFGACASDAACRAAYPEPKESLFATLREFGARPLTVPVDGNGPLSVDEFTINPQDLLFATHLMLFQRSAIALVPFTLEAMRTRNEEALRGLVDTFGEQVAGLINRGTYHLVECYERGPFGSGEGYEALTAGHPRMRDGFTYYRVDQEVCDAWSKEHAGLEEALPVKSGIPALILAGDFDPMTPPEWGVRAARTLRNSYFLQFPGLAHAVSISHPCPEAITVAFIRDPSRAPDASCADETGPIAFVTNLHVNSGVYRLAKALLVNRDIGAVIASAAVTLALITGAFWSSLAALIGWLTGRRERQRPGGTGAHRLATTACGVALVFLLGLGLIAMIVVRENPIILAFGVPGWAAPLFWLPFLVALTMLGAILLTPSAWRSHWWSAWGRLLHTVAILGCVGFLALLLRFGIL
jgi:pimeloyl-ACP methyl ester carboxylesterase